MRGRNPISACMRFERLPIPVLLARLGDFFLDVGIRCFPDTRESATDADQYEAAYNDNFAASLYGVGMHRHSQICNKRESEERENDDRENTVIAFH